VNDHHRRGENILKTNANAAAVNPTDGRLMGMLSIAAFPAAILLQPTLFGVAGFFLALIGLTVAAPKQRPLSIAGLVLAVAGFGLGATLNIALF
jgi:hypothetical protein